MKKITSIAFISLFIIAACGAQAKFDNFNLVGSAKDMKESTIGKNNRMVYMSAGSVDSVCDEQANLIKTAGWQEGEQMRKKETYKTGSFKNETSNVTLMCSEQENGEVKVTLTLQKGQ